MKSPGSSRNVVMTDLFRRIACAVGQDGRTSPWGRFQLLLAYGPGKICRKDPGRVGVDTRRGDELVVLSELLVHPALGRGIAARLFGAGLSGVSSPTG